MGGGSVPTNFKVAESKYRYPKRLRMVFGLWSKIEQFQILLKDNGLWTVVDFI